MWKLNPPDVSDAERELLAALGKPNGKPKHHITRSQRTWILRLYEKYDRLGGQPCRALLGGRFAPTFARAVYDAYTQVYKAGRLASLRSRLKLAAPKCPYCGFGEIYELDHHLPRNVYRLLSIYARNLIPCCHACNHKKGAHAEESPDRQIAHVYLEDFPAARFMYANVDVSRNGLRVTFFVERCVGMSEDLFRRLQFQFKHFELNARYQPEIDTLIGSLRSSIEDAAKGGPESLVAWLTKTRDTLESQFGLNDWRPALLDSLCRSNEFCQGGYKHCFGVSLAGA